jgi:hypothetical protein
MAKPMSDVSDQRQDCGFYRSNGKFEIHVGHSGRNDKTQKRIQTKSRLPFACFVPMLLRASSISPLPPRTSAAPHPPHVPRPR